MSPTARMAARASLILLLLAAVGTPQEGASGVTPLEHEAARSLADDAPPFVARADLADRLRAALENPVGAEPRGRLALLWVKAMRHALGAIPMTVDATGEEPYRTWLASHDEVVYNEPGGSWVIETDRLWSLHDEHRRTASADALAWEAVENGLPGECEGYVPCYLVGLDLLHGEYLRRHPNGGHAAAAVEQIRGSCEQSVKLLSGKDSGDFLDPETDCEDLVPPADALKQAMERASTDARAALTLLATLRAHCP